ncbi:hypothetical protein BVRB_4g078050 [Beta vulgaris subsp. vulgaris]|nr:hypothetical protein BVRB_4g078050 [Beta vulgaris subsp. vulgaris]
MTTSLMSAWRTSTSSTFASVSGSDVYTFLTRLA